MTMTHEFSAAIFDFSDEAIRQAAAAGRLLAMEIEFNRACNYRCPYCYAGEPQMELPCMSSEEIDSVIRQAAALGVRKLVVLGGEPLLYQGLGEKLALIAECGMVAEVFTNGALLTPELAALFYRYRARVVLKFNSLRPEVQERMTGVPGALDKALRALEILRQSGYSEPGLLAASSVICSENVDDMPSLWRWLRIHDIIPYFEIMTPQGRMLQNRYLHVEPRRLREVFEEIAAIDREFGREWEPQPPLVGGKCFRHLYSCLVNASGEVLPCVGVTTVLGNIRERPVAQILAESSVIRDLKDYRSKLKGPCRRCARSEECYGCRGAAYQMTGDYLGSDPLCWLNADRQHEIRFLPHDARGLLPHGAPMGMIDTVLQSGEETLLQAEIRADNRFLDSVGVFDRAAVPELAAQAAAAAESFREDGRIVPGMLVGISSVAFAADIVRGDRLIVAIRETGRLNEWHIVKFRIVRETDGAQLASGDLKLCVSAS